MKLHVAEGPFLPSHRVHDTKTLRTSTCRSGCDSSERLGDRSAHVAVEDVEGVDFPKWLELT